MTTFEIITCVLSGLALFVSLFNWRQQSQHNDAQQRLTEREVELVRIQLQQVRQEERKSVTASMSARLYKDGKDWRVKVFNRGPSEARNVNVIVAEDGGFVLQSDLARKFPMARMEQHQSVEISAYIHMQSPSKQDVEIIWSDQSGLDRSNIVTLTM